MNRQDKLWKLYNDFSENEQGITSGSSKTAKEIMENIHNEMQYVKKHGKFSWEKFTRKKKKSFLASLFGKKGE